MSPLRGYITSYPPRIRQYGNALLTPVIPQTQVGPTPRTTKRGTTAVNYAEDGFDDDDFDDSEGPRRPTGLRSLRREESATDKTPLAEKLGKEIHAPVEVQGVFRDWMIKRMLRPACADQLQIQAQLPLTLIPIRIDLEVPAHQPLEPFPLPRGVVDPGINPTLPGYRRPDPLPAFRIKDTFLWNLHEALATPEEFAMGFVRDLDLPNPQAMTLAISNQIRQQLEEYAGVALHPLFQSTQLKPAPTSQTNPSRDVSATPVPTQAATPDNRAIGVSVTKEALVNDSILNPDDAYRCLINLNINLQNRLYTDKFEWSLLHPPGMAEEFAQVTCADLGLGGEWVGAIAHGIYEAVLKLKKEVCESGGMISGMGGYGNEIDNQAANGTEAGWRYDPEGLGDEWEPKVETLSKEEIEKREGDRERQIRRLRRETARFSSTAGITPDMSRQGSGYFDVDSETPLGRGERSKRKRRFRSLSPSGRGGTPGGRGTPDTGSGAGYGGGGGTLSDWERQSWRCSNCMVWGSAVWAVRDGPAGPRTLCHNCGLLYERDKVTPEWSRDLHRHDVPVGR
ncbi:RSC complex subunit Sfh1, putative [Aspergillus lentulus]|uniref:RSC complex subunit Sfh1, putative n=1 Tax=Aspergillus lentulus TaxID=293939 RepID=A0ABQ1AIP3_ASPLE|nr:RSC complex subunit Sfh1, putative [Aspergillus lentulus]GFF25426.1 RSC complex subunit Sfh1, putative [Aspergillus lentulus]GFF61250.1 RSC complex subunit Sfh1, putative [Aspergillus lentulus]GFF82637.1 RSC complex subunit Sfh1, putative [Aspergillus lentulus]GFF85498.1 RSC complex subunit Sfh1, putative [Aspergillus lentulus]GFG00045.1 RSC complex subunit Sfh1, putative [Aspergillus lentulus]